METEIVNQKTNNFLILDKKAKIEDWLKNTKDALEKLKSFSGGNYKIKSEDFKSINWDLMGMQEYDFESLQRHGVKDLIHHMENVKKECENEIFLIDGEYEKIEGFYLDRLVERVLTAEKVSSSRNASYMNEKKLMELFRNLRLHKEEKDAFLKDWVQKDENEQNQMIRNLKQDVTHECNNMREMFRKVKDYSKRN
jgi:hypothetical protein